MIHVVLVEYSSFQLNNKLSDVMFSKKSILFAHYTKKLSGY